MAAKSYCYPDSKVLINKLDIRDFDMLVEKERFYSYFRLAQLEAKPIRGNFDLKHLQDIHKQLFKDVYSWAGELRTLDISKGGTNFAPSHIIKSYADDLFSKLKRENYLKDLTIDKFADRLAYHASELNVIHPFREGNGRATREFIRELADNAGYEISYAKIPKEELYNAFVKSVDNYSDLKQVFKNHIMENIRSHYIDELPSIKIASDSLLNKFQEIKKLSPDGEFLSLKDIKSMYKDLGTKIDNGLLPEGESTFKLISEVNMEVRKLQSQSKDISQEFNKNLSKSINIDMEL